MKILKSRLFLGLLVVGIMSTLSISFVSANEIQNRNEDGDILCFSSDNIEFNKDISTYGPGDWVKKPVKNVTGDRGTKLEHHPYVMYFNDDSARCKAITYGKFSSTTARAEYRDGSVIKGSSDKNWSSVSSSAETPPNKSNWLAGWFGHMRTYCNDLPK